jgi:hypothetical protein
MSKAKQWEAVALSVEGGWERHVIPLEDRIPHVESPECRCTPLLITTEGVLIHVHRSADGREANEPDAITSDSAHRPS